MIWKRVLCLAAAVVIVGLLVQAPAAADEFEPAPAPDREVNLNHVVDLADLVLVSSHYDQMGSPGWRRWDIIRDGWVWLDDVIQVSAYYDTQYNYPYYVQEVDLGGFRWDNPPGAKTLKYRWGVGDIGPGSAWRGAFEASTNDWNQVEGVYPFQAAAFQFAYGTLGYHITIGTIDVADYTLWGATACDPQTASCVSTGNTFPELTDNERRDAAAHELGHAFGLGHIGDSVIAVFRIQPWDIDRDFFRVPQNDDVFLVHQVYP